jgi:hypothetical protein
MRDIYQVAYWAKIFLSPVYTGCGRGLEVRGYADDLTGRIAMRPYMVNVIARSGSYEGRSRFEPLKH